MKKKKKKKKENVLRISNPQYEQVAIIYSDIYIRQQAPNIFWDQLKNMHLVQFQKENCKKKKKNITQK